MNQITLLGRLAKDPEMRYTENGIAVTRFTLAVTRENDKNKADFFYCLAFRKQAESMAEFCRKGRQVLLSGRIEINTRNKDDGSIENFTNVIANRVEFLAKPREQHQEESKQQPEQHQQQRFQPTKDGWKNPNSEDLPF